MKKVLIVSYNFPPVGGAGVQRPVKFVKYLRKYGWEPIVLTVKNPSVPVIDETLLNDIPNDVIIYKAKTFEPSYASKKKFVSSCNKRNGNYKAIIKKIIANIMLPDLQILWWPSLIVKLIYIIKKEKPMILFVSGPPFSSFVPVVIIGRILGVPVVLDYRDEWAFSREHWENSVNSKLAKIVDAFLESYMICRCNIFITANKSYANSICKSYPKTDCNKARVITNGYDEADFLDVPTRINNTKILIIYSGTVWRATSLKNFIAAINELHVHNNANVILDSILIKIYGRIVEEEKCYLRGNSMSKYMEIHGYADHTEVIKEIGNADILLLTLSDLNGSEKIITGKVFEYMATGKHIFAVVPNGETKDILVNNYDNMTFADPDSVENIKMSFYDIISKIDVIRKQYGKDVSQFTRENLTYQLSNMFNEVITPQQQ